MIKSLHKIWLVGSLTCLAGCLSLSQAEMTQNLLSAPQIESPVGSSSFFSEGNWPEEHWWTVFQSPELNDLIGQALFKNPTLQNIEERVERAKQNSIVSRGKLFPLIFFNATDNWQYLSKNGLYHTLNPDLARSANLIDLTLGFTYEFDFWSKYRNQFRAAVGFERAEMATLAESKLIVTTAIAQSYFALQTNLRKAQLIEELYQVRKHLSDLQELLQKNALHSKLPVLAAQEALCDVEQLRDEIMKEVALNRHVLNQLVGNGPDVPLVLSMTLPALPPTIAIPNRLSLDLLSRRPDLMAQIWKVEALAHEVGAARADFFPAINLASFLGLESLGFNHLLRSSSGTTGVEPALHLPIYTAGAIQANINAKQASFNAAIYEYNELMLKSAQEVADLLSLAQAIFAQQAKQEVIVSSAQERNDLTSLRQKNGLDNGLQAYALQEEVLQKKIANMDLIYGQYRATIKLIKALGGGYFSDFNPLVKEET